MLAAAYFCVVKWIATLLFFLLSVGTRAEMPDKEVADTLPASSVAASMKQAVRLDKLAAPFTSAFALEMEQRGLGSPRALSTIVPNLHIPDYGSAMTSSVYLRGFGSRIDNPVLGLYIDDIPILDKNLYDFDFLDIRRADLLRGPQGANLLDREFDTFYFKSVGNSFFQRGKPRRLSAGVRLTF